MIKSIEFTNFRNLHGKYEFNDKVSVVIGRNNSGKTNLLDGIRLAFSAVTNDYFKISPSDFHNSDDSLNIIIQVELNDKSIHSLDSYDDDGNLICGFILTVRKTQSGRYVKDLSLLNGSNVDYDALREDANIPNVFLIPLLRIDEIYTTGLVTGISKFIDSEDKYKQLKDDSKKKIRDAIQDKVSVFQSFCKKFNQELDIELTEPRISDEKVFIVEEGQREHNYKIGSGYRSIANIILNTLNDNYNIILIDEIENHLHPSLIRTLIRELQLIPNTQVVATTHSYIVINEFQIEEIIDIDFKKIQLSKSSIDKLNMFLHAGRSELLLSDNIVLVEGYTEEFLLKNYLREKNKNWNIINVAGVMFEPYIEIANYLHKKIVVISDNDKAISEKLDPSDRFVKLSKYCNNNGVRLIEVNNTLETDLFNDGFLANCSDLMTLHGKHAGIMIARTKCKTAIAERIIENKVDLSNWHVIKELFDEFESH